MVSIRKMFLSAARWVTGYKVSETPGHFFGYQPTAAGVDVTEDGAMALSAVYAAVRLIAEAIGTLPLSVHKDTGGRKEKAENHPAYRLLHSTPNPDMTAFVFRRVMQTHVLLWGNAYAEIQWFGNGNAYALWPIEPWKVKVERNDDGRIVYRIDGQRIVRAEDMIHVHGMGYDGLEGKSVIGFARESLGLTAASERSGAGLFGNGLKPSGVFKHPSTLSEKGRENLRKSLKDEHAGPGKFGKVLFLEEGMDFAPTTINPTDAQFLETRKFQTVEIARWFNVPPHMIRDLERATFSNIEHQGVEFVKYTLSPWFACWEQELDRKLLSPPKAYAKFNADALLRGDTAARAAFYSQLLQVGAISPNEIAAKEDLPPAPKGGDDRYVPMNMAKLGEDPKEPESPPPAPQGEGDEDQGEKDPGPATDQGAGTGEAKGGEQEGRQGMAQRMVPPRPKLSKEARDALVSHQVGRMLRKEGEAAKRASKEPSTFLAWLDAFYTKHVETFSDAIRPVVLALLDGTGADIRANVARATAVHIGWSRSDLLKASEVSAAKLPESVAACVEAWAARYTLLEIEDGMAESDRAAA